jgi:hypothetical protein
MNSRGTNTIASATTYTESAMYWAGSDVVRWATWLASQLTMTKLPSTSSHDVPSMPMAMTRARPVANRNASISVKATTAAYRCR